MTSRGVFLSLLLLAASNAASFAAGDSETLKLHARKRTETQSGSGLWHATSAPLNWKASETAIVVCDMWDRHWCENSSRRVAEMAPVMNRVLRAAREQGVFIIHCPSDTMDFYANTPQRKLAMAAPAVPTAIPLERWCYLDKDREGDRLPIDDSDGGCDCSEPVRNYRAWSRQHPDLEIHEGDAITDNAEAYYLMKQRGITNVIVMGVHTNMCVLGRPFSIRQMVRQGQNVVLMRDMTDTMYNPAMQPFVSHFSGTDLVVEHIEQYWCPTITSVDFLGGQEFRFAEDTRPHIAVIMSEPEYQTDRSLTRFARTHLARSFRTSLIYGHQEHPNELPGLNVCSSADLAIISVRRRTPAPDDLQIFRDFVAAGKPVLGIRTASHAFCLRNQPAPEGTADWPEFDRDVIGGSYTNHWGAGPLTQVSLASGIDATHPLLKGVDLSQLTGHGSLYKVSPLQPSSTPLLTGTIPDAPSEPIAWINRRADGGLTFYTSFGHVDDFTESSFNTLLTNAAEWLIQETGRR